MNIQLKLKSLKRWQKEKGLTKFKCQNDENHEMLKPIISKGEVLLKCPTCNRKFKCLNDTVYEYGKLLLLQDKKNRRN